MSNLQYLLDLANEAAELSAIDMSESSTGGGRQLLEENYYLARFCEYIELGKHAREYQGKPKPAALNFRLGFALFGEGVQSEDGTPYLLRTYDMTLGNNEKARAKQAFDNMNYVGTAKHFAQLLSQPFLIYVTVETSKKTGKQYNSIDFAKVGAPVEALSRKPYDVPDIDEELYRVFLWDRPTQETWDSLFIEGTFDDGKSKNYIQETCLAAVDFQGSALHQLLSDAGLTLPEAPKDLEGAEEASAEKEAAEEEFTAPPVPTAPKAPATPKTPGAPKAAVPPKAAAPKAAAPKAAVPPAVKPAIGKVPPIPKAQ